MTHEMGRRRKRGSTLADRTEALMIVNLADRDLITWAVEHGIPFYYTQEQGLPSPCLKVHFGHVTAYFCRGQLTRLWAHADRACLDEMFEQLMKIFELCGRCGSLIQFDEAKTYWQKRVTASHLPP